MRQKSQYKTKSALSSSMSNLSFFISQYPFYLLFRKPKQAAKHLKAFRLFAGISEYMLLTGVLLSSALFILLFRISSRIFNYKPYPLSYPYSIRNHI